MDSWPVDDRNPTSGNSESKGGPKAEQQASVRGYPQVDVGGPNVITLVEKDGRLEWTSIVKNIGKANYIRPGKNTIIFPTTRPPPSERPSRTILQSAERGANFLRTYLPDVDIPAELIRDELAQDAKISEKLGLFDPYMGNLLQPVTVYDSAFLAFPMGELNRDLNIAPFRETSNGVVFRPSIHPTRTFATPIQQIATSIPGMQTAYMAVRTFGQTSLLEVNTSKTTPYLAEVTNITRNDTGGRAIVDFTLFTGPLSSIVVNDFGQVYRCSVSGGDKYVDLLRPAPEDEGANERDHFWHLARCTHVTDYLLASKSSLSQIDIRSNDSIELFSPMGADLITSVEDQQTEHIVKLSSTRELLWIDSRFPRNPLLCYKHGRQFDRSLRVLTSPMSALTLLTSRANAMVSLYDISRLEREPIHINALPRCFMSDPQANASYVGQALFKHPFDTGPDAFSLIQLSERGSLHQVNLSMSDEAVATFKISWTTEVKELESQPLPALETPYAGQAYAETDLSATYNQIFCVHEQNRERREEDSATVVYDLLETIPTFWQEVEAPPEHILTTYDAVLRAGDEPTETSRADFLTESIINSTRGYRAFTQGRLSAAALAKGASWHKNITGTLQRLDLAFPDDIQSSIAALERYNLAEDPQRSAQSLRYEKEAREQLALELALSADVFSSQPFSRASEEGLALEDLTKTLSLAGEPQTVDFGYLRPKPKSHYKTEDPNEDVTSMGVRSLLKDWQIGADPEEYVFTNHYDGSLPKVQLTQNTHPTQTTESIPQPLGTQRPPTIVAASTLPARPPEVGRRMFVQSQPDFGMVLPSRVFGYGSQAPLTGLPQTQSSQEYMMSTQILPGVHGGRPTASKKKPVKRRVGGF